MLFRSYLLAQVYEEKIPAAENNRLSEIAGKLLSGLRNKERTFTFKYDQSGTPNALAIPGGFIYISEKLIDLCGEDRDRSEERREGKECRSRWPPYH